MEISKRLPTRIIGLASNAVAVGLLLAAQTVASPAEAQSARVQSNAKTVAEGDEAWRALFRKSTNAFEEHRYADAKALLQQASAIKVTPKILANLAQVELQLGEYRAAATHATEALAALGSNPGIEEDLATAAKQLGKLVVYVNVEGAAITVDRVEVGVSPIPRPLFVEPGPHQIVVAKTGYEPTTRDYRAEKGSEQSFAIELLPTAVGQVAPTDAAATSTTALPLPGESRIVRPPAASPSRPSSVLLIAGGAIAVSGLVTGFYLNSKANTEADRADELGSSLGRSGCVSPRSSRVAQCVELMEHRGSHDRARDWSTVGFVVGGAALLGTAAYWFWPRRTSSGIVAGVRIEAMVSPSESWLGFAGRF